MIEGPYFSTTFKCQFMAFCQKIAEKNSLKFFEIYLSYVFLPKNSILNAKNSLKCESTLKLAEIFTF